MNRFIGLYINEMTKVFRRASTYILLGLAALAVVGVGLLMWFSQNINSLESDESYDPDQWAYENMQNEIESLRGQIQSILEQQDYADRYEGYEKDSDWWKSLEIERIIAQNTIDELQVRIEMKIPRADYAYQSNISYLNDVITIITDCDNLIDINAAGLSDYYNNYSYTYNKTKMTIDSAQATRATLNNVLLQRNFAGYIDYLNSELDRDKSLSQEELSLQKEINNLWLKGDPNGEKNLINTINVYRQNKKMLNENCDESGMKLTESRREEITRETEIYALHLKNGIVLESNYDISFSSLAGSSMIGSGLFFILLLLIILGGSSISREISTGSIKMLIIAPAKRHKIYTAKLMSILTVWTLSIVFVYLLGMAAQAIFFSEIMAPVAAWIGNGAVLLPYPIYFFLYVALTFVDVLFWAVLAFMLSTITRNTALSVGISIASYFVGSIAQSILMFVGNATKYNAEWIRFLPFNNMSLGEIVFPSVTSELYSMSGITNTLNSFVFSVVYLAVCFVLMLFVGYDSFCRRDIK